MPRRILRSHFDILSDRVMQVEHMLGFLFAKQTFDAPVVAPHKFEIATLAAFTVQMKQELTVLHEAYDRTIARLEETQ